ncbi:MAG: hypothetical protein KAW09_12465 [Thermoplasmata archaeon]|nr:hypothetical protein [Thermoplasmata archaeon]
MIEDLESEKTSEQEEEETRFTVHFLFSALLFVLGIFILPTSGYLLWVFSGALKESFPVITVILGVLVVCGILEIVGSIGLFKMKPWARTLSVWVVFIAFLMHVSLVANITAYGATQGGSIEDVPFFLSLSLALLLGPILIHLMVFLYFFTKEGKAVFVVSQE